MNIVPLLSSPDNSPVHRVYNSDTILSYVSLFQNMCLHKSMKKRQQSEACRNSMVSQSIVEYHIVLDIIMAF